MNNSAYFYLISNRAYDPLLKTFGDKIAANGALTFFAAPVSNPSSFEGVDYPTWLHLLKMDLERSGHTGMASGTFFFHGFGVSFAAAQTDYATYFTNLASDQGGGYPGVLVGFDWPSNVGFQVAKQNAQTTAAQSFPLLAAVVQKLQQSVTAYLGAICHSMGNYLMYEGASQLVSGGTNTFSEILCVGAMLESTAFNSPSSATWCQDITGAAKRVTLFYSVHDDVLPDAEVPGLDGYPELGIYGPGYDACLLGKVVGVDCSAVVNQANAEKYETGQQRILIHTAYFYIPETLKDISQTLLATPPNQMSDRRPIAGTTAGFMMKGENGAGAAAAVAGADSLLPWAAAVAAKP